MFNIHAFREQWELMPTALSLKTIMDELETDDRKELREITGLSLTQVERCIKILSYPERFQMLSLNPNQAERIPSNFWVELYPVLELATEVIPDLYSDLGRDGITENMVEKYKEKKIRSVVHFRRIMEAFEVAEDDVDRQAVADRLREYILTPELETRQAFDGFIRDTRRINRVITACDEFMTSVERAKVDYSIDGKDELISKLTSMVAFIERLIDKLVSEESPQVIQAEDE